MSEKRVGDSHENATGDARFSGDRKFVVALARGLDVLRSFRPDDDMLGNLEIAERTGIPKPTVSRLTYTLTQLGYLAHVQRFSKYKIAPAALALGYSALAQLGIRQIARPYMQAIADHAGASVALGAPDKRRMIYVEHCYEATALMVRLDIGSRIPLAASAMGRAYIAVLPREKREELFEDLAWFYGDKWPALRSNIDLSCEQVARQGFSISMGDWRQDINGIGVPLIMPDGSGIYAFNCGAAAFSLSRDRLEQDIGPRLLDAVRQIRTVLNGGAGEWQTGQNRQH